MEEKLRLLLTHLRTVNNVTQDDLAQNLNISRQALSFYERGLRKYPFDIIVSILNHFNMSLTIKDNNLELSPLNTKNKTEVRYMDTSKAQLQSALNKLDKWFFSNINNFELTDYLKNTEKKKSFNEMNLIVDFLAELSVKYNISYKIKSNMLNNGETNLFKLLDESRDKEIISFERDKKNNQSLYKSILRFRIF